MKSPTSGGPSTYPLHAAGGPQVIAHRGANREAQENTLAAFEAAISLGADAIELDIQLTSDGVPVVHHDSDVNTRGAVGRGRSIDSLTRSELHSRAASIPTLDEVIETVAGRCYLYIEIKAPRALESVLHIARRLDDGCAIHSFDHRAIATASELAPDIPRGILLVSHLVDPLSALRAASARDLWQHVDFVDRQLVDRVHAGGCRVIAWTVNDPARARHLIDMGIDGLCTDAPRELRAQVNGSS